VGKKKAGGRLGCPAQTRTMGGRRAAPRARLPIRRAVAMVALLAAVLALRRWRAAAAETALLARLRVDERITSHMESGCSDTCVALAAGPRCRARCKKAKRRTAEQAVLRGALGIGGGPTEARGSEPRRAANASAVCGAGGALVVDRWAGRLGNALLQVANCLSFAVAGGCVCYAPSDAAARLVDASRVPGLLRLHGDGGLRALAFRDSFWNVTSPAFGDPRTRDAVLAAMRAAFAAPPIADDGADVVVHVRGGDVFAIADQTHYVPPPLSYYVDAIERHGFARIRIVAEDDANPVVAGLLARYGGRATWRRAPLAEDAARIVGARRVIYGQGTFVPALLMLSERLEAYVRVDYAATDPYLGSAAAPDREVANLIPWFRAVFPWRATPRQLARLTTWPD